MEFLKARELLIFFNNFFIYIKVIILFIHLTFFYFLNFNFNLIGLEKVISY